MLRKFFKSKPRTIHLLHIGKTGGTSLTKMLKGLSNKRYIIKIHPHEFSLRDVPKDDLAIFFLRNPIDRFVSGFYSRKRKGQPTYNVPWNLEEEKAFAIFESPSILAEALSSGDSQIQKDAINAMNGIRHVNTHFKDWLIDQSYLENHIKQLFFIGFQENFDEDLKALYLKITKKEWNQEVIRSHQTAQKEDKLMSEKASLNIKHWYEDDFELYQFCKTLSQKVN